MGDIEKRLNKAAIKKGSVWDTEVDVNAAGTGLLAQNPGAPKANPQMIEEDSALSPFETDLDVGNINPSDFSLDFDYRWDGLENILLAMLFGTSPAPTQQAATTAYLHALSLANSAAGLFGTYAVEKGTKIHVVPSFKVMKGSFSFNSGLIKASFGLRGSRVIDNSAIITAMSSVTPPANAHHRAKACQAVFRMNAQTGAAFESTDEIRPKAFTLDVDRKMDSEHGAASQVIVESRENGKPSAKLSMEFSRMDAVNAAYFAEWIAGTEKKADIVITGPLIASTYYYYLKFQFPRLIIEDVEYADAGIIPAKLALRAVVADAAPTGMTGLTLPVYVGIMNTRTTGLLA